MAEVWLARERGIEGFQRLLVVKRILPHLADDPEFVQMFLNEAKIAARFTHPNIAQIYNLGETNGTYFIAMEFVHGEDLGRVMRKAWSTGQWIARPLSIRIVASACEGLNYAHSKTDESGRPLKVVHRDISPQNILISFDGSVKLVDFGIAKAADQASLTKSGAIKGKFAYMSPEQAAGKALDQRSDIFAIGLVLYELLTGVRPLKRDSELATLQAALECKIEPPSQVADVPRELDDVVMRALAKAADDRYREARAFQMALEETLVAQRWVASSVQISELMGTLFSDRLAEEAKLGHPDPESQDSKSGTPQMPPPPEPHTERGRGGASSGSKAEASWEAPPGQEEPRSARHSRVQARPARSLARTSRPAREALTDPGSAGGPSADTSIPDAPSWDAPSGQMPSPRRRTGESQVRARVAREDSQSGARSRPGSGSGPRPRETGDAEAWSDPDELEARRAQTRDGELHTQQGQGDGLPPVRSKSVTKVPRVRSRPEVPTAAGEEEEELPRAQAYAAEDEPPPEDEGLEPFEPELPARRSSPAPQRAAEPKPPPRLDSLDLANVVDPYEQRKQRLALMRKLSMVAGGAVVVILALLFWRPVWDALSSTANDGLPIYLTVEANQPVNVFVKHHADHASGAPTLLGPSPVRKQSGAHIRDTILLENRQLGISYEEEIKFGQPGELKTIKKEFQTGRYELRIKPANLRGLGVYLNDERVADYVESLPLSLVEGKHHLELRGNMLKDTVPVEANVQAGRSLQSEVIDLTPHLLAVAP